MWLGLVVEGTTQTTGEEQRLEAGCTHMHRLTIVDKVRNSAVKTVFYFLMPLSQIDIQMQKEPVPIIPVGKDHRPNVKT